MEIQLIWLRHGETEENANNRYLGHRDVPLNAKGLKQADLLAEQLKQIHIQTIYSSDLTRSKQTAWAYGKETAIPIIESSLLRELSFGGWDGFTFDEIHAKDPEHVKRWIENPFQVAPPGGETLLEMEQRLSRWLQQVEQHHPEQTIAVFTHGGPIRWFLALMVARDWNTFWNPDVPHGGGWWVKKDGGYWHVISCLEAGKS